MGIDDIKQVGMVGSGVMGGGIAESLVVGGFKTIVRDINDELCEKTRDTMIEGRFGLRGAVERGKITQQQFDEALGRLSFTTKLEDLQDADLIIEAVPENLDLKKNVFAELDRTVKQSAIFASNTSGFAISDLNKAVARKDKFIGMHFFSPAFVMKLVEIVIAPETSDETVKLIEDISARMGKETVKVKDAPGAYGFIANRVYFAAVAEARKILEGGLATEDDINTAMRVGFNWPVGPLEMVAGARKGWQ
jgi:3-hydroxyacyl-CoA dehydrogenase